MVSMGLYRWAFIRRHRISPEYGLVPWQSPSWSHLRRLLALGWPMSIQFAMDVGSWMVLSVFLGWMGEAALAANQITVRLMSVSFMTVHGVSVAATTVVGQCVGAGQLERARGYSWSAILVGLGILGSVGTGYFLWPGPLVRLFTDDPAVIAVAVPLLLLVLAVQVGDTVAMVSYGSLKGAGDTHFGMYVMVGCAWGVGVPLGYGLAFPLGMGPNGIYLGLTAQMGVAAVLFLLRLRGRGWLDHRVVAVDVVANTPSEGPIAEAASAV